MDLIRRAPRIAAWIAVVGLSAPAVAAEPFATAPTWASPEEVVPGEYIVRLRPGAAVSVSAGRFRAGSDAVGRRLAALTDVRPLLEVSPRRLNAPARRLASAWRVRSPLSLAELRDQLEDQATVDSVEPRLRYGAHADPSDTWYHFQWDMSQADLPTIRTLADGTGAVVAVIDSGVTPGGADGVTSLLQGWDFIDDDDDPSDDDAMVSGLAHGTHVAGTIAQTTDNVEGVAGLAPGTSILPVRVLHYDDPSGAVWGDSDDIAAGIVWAVDHGAHIINLSLGGSTRSEAVADACEYAYEEDVLVVASSGNDGHVGVSYPAALPCAIAVGGVGRIHNVAGYTNTGPELDIVAPGGEADDDRDGDGHGDGIVQESVTENGWRYVFAQGTSMAAPHVSAAAALLVQRGWTGADALAEVLLTTAYDLEEPGFDDRTGFGELDILAALALPVDPASLAESGDVVIDGVQVDYGEDGRAWVSWRTNIAATTVVTGADVEVEELLPTHLHKALVKGTPGFATTVRVASAASGGAEAGQDVEVSFPLPDNHVFAGCAQGAALVVGPWLALWRWRRRRA